MQKTHVLIVDDDENHRMLQKEILDDEKYCVIEVDNGKAALKAITEHSFDVVLLDKRMPGMDGDEVCRRIRNDLGESFLPVVMVTGNSGTDDLSKSLQAGATDFIKKPYDYVELISRLEAAVQRKRLTDQLDDAESLLFTLARMVEAKDECTGNHCSRLAHISGVFGQRLGLSDMQLSILRRGAILHDIGKLAVPDSVLLKNGKLTEEEFELIKQHPTIGARLCSGLKSMRDTLPIIRHHHERWDGSGYPDGLRGEEIPYLARVFQILDIYDALSNSRPYKKAFSTAEVIEIFESETEKGWYEKELMDVFLEVLHTQSEELVLRKHDNNDFRLSIFNDIAATGLVA